ncbi:MAG: DUF4886 domain-containing protein, partial [Acutalibacteraceae bacterium]
MKILKKITVFFLVLTLLITAAGFNVTSTAAQQTESTQPLKILAIGNSFSVDSMRFIYDMFDWVGQKVILGNLIIGGCTLEMHANNIINEAANYTYYKNTTGTWKTKSGYTVQQGLADESWDIITLQQASGYSGIPSSYSYLSTILNFLEANKPTPETRIMWNMTWAYQKNSSHSDFKKYDKNQLTMYNAIISTVQSQIVGNPSFSGIIPTGTAIQNLRTSYFGDTLTRDGYHLSYDYGRYTASLTWFHYLTGISPDMVNWVPPEYPYIAN